MENESLYDVFEKENYSREKKQELKAVYARSKIIVADDNREMAHLLSSHLKLNNHDVIVCHDGASLCKALETNDGSHDGVGVDLIITDIRMPIMDGLEAISKIREKYCYLKIIAITAFGSEETIKTAKLIGADLILSKPFELDELMTTIDRIIGEI